MRQPDNILKGQCYMNNMDKQKVSNYEIMRQNASKAFLSYDHAKTAGKLGLKYRDDIINIKL